MVHIPYTPHKPTIVHIKHTQNRRQGSGSWFFSRLLQFMVCFFHTCSYGSSAKSGLSHMPGTNSPRGSSQWSSHTRNLGCTPTVRLCFSVAAAPDCGCTLLRIGSPPVGFPKRRKSLLYRNSYRLPRSDGTEDTHTLTALVSYGTSVHCTPSLFRESALSR